MKKSYDTCIYFLLVGALVLALYRVVPYFFGSLPLGYDPGLYRDFLLKSFSFLPHIQLGNFVPWIKTIYEPGWGLLGNIFHFAGYSVDSILTWGVGILSVLTGIFLYLVTTKQAKYAGVFALLLYSISIIQYQTFWRNYSKQILGIILMMTAFFLIEQKKYWISIPAMIMLLVSNRPGGAFFLLVLVIWQIIEWKKNKHINTSFLTSLGISLVGSLLIYLPVFHEQILSMVGPLFGSIFIASTSGTFFSKSEFFVYDIFFLLLSMYGAWKALSKHQWDRKLVGYIVGLVWVGLGLFFYSRVAIFWDVFILLFAAAGLADLYQHKKNVFWWIFVPVVLVQGFWYIFYVERMSFPLIEKAELEKIIRMDSIMPADGILMTTNSKYASFVQGRTDKDVLAPGLFELDRRTQEQRDTRHQSDGSVKCAMLREYKDLQRPIYIRLGSKQPVENLSNNTCFEVLQAGGNYAILKWKSDL